MVTECKALICPPVLKDVIFKNTEPDMDDEVENKLYSMNAKFNEISKSKTDVIIDNLWLLAVEMDSSDLTFEEQSIKQKIISELKKRSALKLL